MGTAKAYEVEAVHDILEANCSGADAYEFCKQNNLFHVEAKAGEKFYVSEETYDSIVKYSRCSVNGIRSNRPEITLLMNRGYTFGEAVNLLDRQINFRPSIRCSSSDIKLTGNIVE